MSRRALDRWLPVGFSTVVHATIVALLLWGFWRYKHPAPPPQMLAIEATVVDASRLPAGTLPEPAVPPQHVTAAPQENPPPAPEPPAVLPPPPSAAEEEAQRQKAAEAAKAEQQRQEKERARREAQAEKLREAKEKVEQQRQEAERKQKEESARKAKAEAERKAKEEADRKAKAEAERAAREQAVADQQKAQREAELRARMAAEERFAAAQASGLLAQYQSQIRARIERAWIRPATAKPGLNCQVRITQVPGGEVLGVQVGSCNGDETVRQSIEAAAYRASPLPLPSDPALFDRNLVVTFKPQD
jgi:colicin import membrane protein